MSDSSLHEWLKEIDLLAYKEKITALGAEKVDHLQDLQDEDLKEIGMLPLQVRRFRRKLKEQVLKKPVKVSGQANNHAAEDGPSGIQQKKKVTMVMPFPDVIGRKSLDIPEEELRKEYGELYYVEEMSFKHRECNKFVLPMMAASRWRFSKKRQHIDWGREERGRRFKMLLPFAEKDELVKETKHFKDKNYASQIYIMRKEYKDIVREFGKKEKVTSQKHDKITLFKADMKEILNGMEGDVILMKQYLDEVTGKNGRKEEEDFWRKILRKAELVTQNVTGIRDQLEELAERYSSVLGESKVAKTLKRKKRKNVKKNTKRCVKAKGKKSEQESKITDFTVDMNDSEYHSDSSEHSSEEDK